MLRGKYGDGRMWLVTVVIHNVLNLFLHLQVEYMELLSLVKNQLS